MIHGDYSTRYFLTEEQYEEFYRILFEEGGDAARAYREQFGVKNRFDDEALEEIRARPDDRRYS